MQNKSRALASARAYTSDKTFESIAKMCGLRVGKTWRTWYDECDNELRVFKTRIRINLSEQTEKTSSDFYRKAHPLRIAQVSKWFLAARNNDSAIWFLGEDNHLRFSYFNDGKWSANYLPLTSGINILQLISIKNKVIDYKEASCNLTLGDLKIDRLCYGGLPQNMDRITELKEITNVR